MKVLQEILEWSTDRPSWQRDALRRLVVNGELSDDDILELTSICKGAHGLVEYPAFIPLSEEHIPDKAIGAAPVSLTSIFHHRGVNALAESQTLKFGPKLTVVYGDNAAGKTGYIRILKSACRARGREKILGNVVAGTAPLNPIVAIQYRVGSEPNGREWNGDGEDEFISRVSVFDTQCAAVYLTEKTDVAFRPFGLDLFDKLVQVCKAVRVKLEAEQRALLSDGLVGVKAEIPAATAASNFIAGLSSLTKAQELQTLAQLSTEEEARLAFLEKSLLDLQANDPQKLIRELTLRVERIQTLARHFDKLETILAPSAVKAAFDILREGVRKSEEAKRIREVMLPAGLFNGTGSDTWKALWEVARRFSQEQAYPDQPFPVVGDDARCILCQQNLNSSASERLRKFEAFITSNTERELREVRDAFIGLRDSFANLLVVTEDIEGTLKEIRIEDEELAITLSEALSENELRRKAIVLGLTENKDLAGNSPELVSVKHKVHALADQVAERIKTLQSSASNEEKKRMQSEAQELRARQLLAKHEKIILNEIERKQRYAAYGLALDDTKTQAVTQKSTSITKTVVSQKLKQSFQEEMKRLSFRHVEVELKEAGGAEGVLYHKLILTRAPGVELPKVISEGEQRCLSIGAFFAELSTADDPSGIVFDDPVSSLDYKWREGVAQRLVNEARTRQVVVFTHDVVFLLLLKQYAEELEVELLDQHVRRISGGAGVCAEELPWVALKVSKRIGHLKKLLQDVEKLHRDGHQSAYEREASMIYGYLREAWERGLEEVLLGGLVERYRPGVQTKHVMDISDITTEDCKAVETAMTKCSRWLIGHDEAAAARAAVPEPTELQADIRALEQWVNAIKNRRKKGSSST